MGLLNSDVRLLRESGMERTTIGSFPRTGKPLAAAVDDVVDLQLKYGVDVVTDGEQRADMITYFEQIPGFGRGSRGLKVSGRITQMGNPGEFYKIKDIKLVRARLEAIGMGGVKVKVTITGPVTLGMTAAMGGVTGYRGVRDQTLYEDCADALTPLAEAALDAGALLQIDEPGISARFESPKYTERLLSALPDGAIDEGQVSLHVCGDVGKVWDDLMGLSVGILSFGFSRAQEARNVETLSAKKLAAGKRLGVGFISNTYLEDASVARNRLEKIAGIVGVENIAYIHPDCGFAPTPPDLVEPILENMKKAADDFLG
jgi:5-methyltetrahydropteroyltriglutamate--homocysteine methyltransferase